MNTMLILLICCNVMTVVCMEVSESYSGTRGDSLHKFVHHKRDRGRGAVTSAITPPSPQPQLDNSTATGRFAITPGYFGSVFSTSIASIQSSVLLFNNASTFASAPLSLAVSLLAALVAGFGAIIAVVLVPLQVANQMLAVIALALLVAYLVEDRQLLYYLSGAFNSVKPQTYYAVSGYKKQDADANHLSWMDDIEVDANWNGIKRADSSTSSPLNLQELSRASSTFDDAVAKFDTLNQVDQGSTKQFAGSKHDPYWSSMFL